MSFSWVLVGGVEDCVSDVKVRRFGVAGVVAQRDLTETILLMACDFASRSGLKGLPNLWQGIQCVLRRTQGVDARQTPVAAGARGLSADDFAVSGAGRVEVHNADNMRHVAKYVND